MLIGPPSATSGGAMTVLRIGWYAENWRQLSSGDRFGYALCLAGYWQVASAAKSDYADAAVEALIGHGHERKIYEPAGNAGHSMADAASQLAREADKSAIYHDLSNEDYVAALMKTGMPQPTAQKLANFDVAAGTGGLFDDIRTLAAMIGHATEPLKQAIS